MLIKANCKSILDRDVRCTVLIVIQSHGVLCCIIVARVTLDVALSFTINFFPTNSTLINQNTYIILNASYKGIRFEFDRKNNKAQRWFSYFQIDYNY